MTPVADRSPTHYRFADLTLDVTTRRVTRDGRPIELKTLDFDLLRFLVESAPNVVNTDVLAEKVWGRHFVSPENVAQRVMLLRHSLGDDANKPRYIETVRNKGYRLIPVVESAPAGESGTALWRHWMPAAAAILVIALGITATARYWAGTEEAERTPPIPSSVAVLPFENPGANTDDAAFAAAIQDEIVSQLTKIRGLRVFPVGAGSAKQRAPVEVARDLNVATTLSGSVYYSNGRVRVIPRLTEATTRLTLWSESYEREFDDIFAIQSEIALEVASALRVELSAVERARVESAPTSDPRARELYLTAKTREARYSRKDELLRAIDEVDQALRLDPTFTEAWMLAASVRTYAQLIDWENTELHRRRAEQAARQVLELDPEFGIAYVPLGALSSANKDWLAAETAFRNAAERNVPGASLGPYALLKMSAGHFEFGRDIWEQGRAAFPQQATGHRFLAFIYEAIGDRARAKALYESAIDLFRTDDEREVEAMLIQRMHWLVGRAEVAEARTIAVDDALNAAMLANLDSPPHGALAELRLAHHAAGANSSQLRNIGLWAGHFGDAALALDAMRSAIDAQGQQMIYLWLPQLAPMRGLPEFEDYMREIGMVAYWQEYGWPPFCERLDVDAHDFECD